MLLVPSQGTNGFHSKKPLMLFNEESFIMADCWPRRGLGNATWVCFCVN